ncbi:hypothetical protein COV49_03280 [Candidatus Falkowbacteria bacterium CG11_big_fil_rev_8_21_14_0_20_39_10]|uniref:Uncharacterized protein n=1 Tax=Candidatus Falkowbacteria bacterium CG11_big_fil_rev_8_21_14_0_20_39_10 TaxID=1974570 RepID=A0A2M6K8N5_9BACT|nr:MAG: hypothetical protein COV49_03280 [Candidatus Falkowbacteria bacterium CG11_big_fil_rev_8_21_14_0_20_39_10]
MTLDLKQLESKDFLEKTKILTQDIISEDRFRKAYDLAKELEQSTEAIKDFKEKNYELYREYKNIIIKLYWLGLPIMTEDRVIHMFRHYFIDIFKIPDYDIWAKLKTVLLGIVVFEDRDKFKKQLINSLTNNQQVITKKQINLDNQNRSPRVANWIKDYNQALGAGSVDALARTQYLTNSKNIKDLSQEEKDRVKVLFDLYEKLKLSSLTIEGLEEDIPVDEEDMRGTVKGGVLEPFKETAEQKKIREIIFGTKGSEESDSYIGNSYSLDELQKLASQYPAGSLERKAIEEEISKIQAGDGDKKIR